MPRGTPLYGQPSWWGEDEAEEQNGYKPDSKPEEKIQETGVLGKVIYKQIHLKLFPTSISHLVGLVYILSQSTCLRK